jgi:hypothetical protein
VLSYPKQTWKDWIRQKKRHLTAGKYYTPVSRLILGFLTISHILFYGCFFWILCTGTQKNTVLAGFILRISLMTVIFGLISKKIKENFATISLPLLDFLYILNYLVVGIKAVVSRKATWK